MFEHLENELLVEKLRRDLDYGMTLLQMEREKQMRREVFLQEELTSCTAEENWHNLLSCASANLGILFELVGWQQPKDWSCETNWFTGFITLDDWLPKIAVEFGGGPTCWKRTPFAFGTTRESLWAVVPTALKAANFMCAGDADWIPVPTWEMALALAYEISQEQIVSLTKKN